MNNDLEYCTIEVTRGTVMHMFDSISKHIGVKLRFMLCHVSRMERTRYGPNHDLKNILSVDVRLAAIKP